MQLVERAIDRLHAWSSERKRARYVAEHETAKAEADSGKLKDKDLIYAA